MSYFWAAISRAVTEAEDVWRKSLLWCTRKQHTDASFANAQELRFLLARLCLGDWAMICACAGGKVDWFKVSSFINFVLGLSTRKDSSTLYHAGRERTTLLAILTDVSL